MSKPEVHVTHRGGRYVDARELLQSPEARRQMAALNRVLGGKMSTINERIAKVKGLRRVYVVQTQHVYLKDADGNECPMKNWSGSIADAWGLVPELQKHGPIVISELDDGWHVDLMAGPDSEAPIISEAISLVYLAVMEGE